MTTEEKKANSRKASLKYYHSLTPAQKKAKQQKSKPAIAKYRNSEAGKVKRKENARQYSQRMYAPRRDAVRAILDSLKTHYGCMNVDCKITWPLDPCCLDFHHIDATEKKFNLGNYHGCIKPLVREIRKCTILCAICHRLHTWGTFDASTVWVENHSRGGNADFDLCKSQSSLGFWAEIDDTDNTGKYAWTALEPQVSGDLNENDEWGSGTLTEEYAVEATGNTEVRVGSRVWMKPAMNNEYYIFLLPQKEFGDYAVNGSTSGVGNTISSHLGNITITEGFSTDGLDNDSHSITISEAGCYLIDFVISVKGSFPFNPTFATINLNVYIEDEPYDVQEGPWIYSGYSGISGYSGVSGYSGSGYSGSGYSGITSTGFCSVHAMVELPQDFDLPATLTFSVVATPTPATMGVNDGEIRVFQVS